MLGRWHLNRAGILNVYQYGDETIDLAGGRLLLRGVNGSGKSTAMNMLLPFLLEADARRIDAAGEQTGVLRSWMLTGREEPNPVGYLWIEFARINADGELDHFVCGCGIRANASTDRVTTWWFATDRRPGFDFSLLDRRTPLTVDALRTILGPTAVFGHERRGDYRTEVRARLFGGADLEQHIRLLHIVRSPRVGDRIDVDLPSYLESALPQLSEAALADAAQPLEDLDEHRDNVASLRRTTEALAGLSVIYESYARLELRNRAANTEDLHRVVRAARRDQEAANANAAAAAVALSSSELDVSRLEDDDARFDNELQVLRERPAYRDGADLIHLRNHVASLAQALQTAEADADRCGGRRVESAQRASAHHVAFTDAVNVLHRHLEEISAVGNAWRIDPPPAVPSVGLSREAEPGVGDVPVPTSVTLELSSLRSALTRLITDAELRRNDIAVVIAALDAVVKAEADLRAAEDRLTQRKAEVSASDTEAQLAQRQRQHVEDEWRSASEQWLRDIEHIENVDLDGTADVSADASTSVAATPDLLDRLDMVVRALMEKVQRVIDHHGRLIAQLDSSLDQQRGEVERCGLVSQDLADARLPDPPALSWQRPHRRKVLAEAIEFASDVAVKDQLGIEAAMEASGLLSAELHTSGAVVLVTGELLVVGRSPVPAPLSRFVTALDGDETVTAILHSITTDPHAEAQTFIATDGEFRIGAISGRHTKSIVEHIGVANRRAALERRRAEAATALIEAEALVGATENALDARRRQLDQATAHRNAFPSTQPLTIAVAQSDAAQRVADRARTKAIDAEHAVVRADAAHAEKLADGHRIAANRLLPFERNELRDGANAMSGLIAECRATEPRVAAVESSLRTWASSVETWRSALADHIDRVERTQLRRREHGEQLACLVTLEDTVGIAWAEVVAIIEATERERNHTRTELHVARSTVKHAAAEHSRIAEVARTSAATLADREHRCSSSLPGLQAALGVAGLVASASSASAPETSGSSANEHGGTLVRSTPNWPSVTESADGARELATAVLRTIPEPERADVGADSVRSSLRQRRENLGAGWDAEDHQPDPTLPLAIVVTGPLGRMPLADASAEVVTQLRAQSSLLTAKQDQALRNLLQGVVAKEVAEKLFAAGELVKLMNRRLSTVTTAHGIGASLRWRRRDDIDADLAGTIDLLAKSPDHRDADEDAALATALSLRIDAARRDDPEATYRDLIAHVLDYRTWHEMSILVHRPGESPRQLARHPRLSEGEKKVVSYLPLFAAVAASCDALAERSPTAPRFLLLDDAFAKVSEDNHGALFGLLVELDLDFIATSERLWGTHTTVPELSICEVVRDAEMSTIVLEHARWNGRSIERDDERDTTSAGSMARHR